MLQGDFERCGDCGAPLVGGAGRTLEDELLCERCYEKKVQSVGWLVTTVVTDGCLVILGVAALIALCFVPITWLVKVPVLVLVFAGIGLLRPHFVAISKDIFMKRRKKW